ncbi:MAG TPA: ADOP family duplicated permease, partial [Terracidiphilus sp.]|nr:ADOP family duplicated permease [Terracidiphilus sp.]
MRLWGWERRKDDLAAELATHLRMAIEDRVARGESPEEARAAAVREMGNPPLVADVTRRQWGWEGLERVWQDVRYSLRQLRKSPGYTITALLTLTLAVGANTAIFGLFYALLLRSLPVERPDRIVQVELQLSTSGAKGQPSPMVSDGMYDALVKTQTSFNGLCGWSGQDVNVHEDEGMVPVPAASLTGECMRVLGLHAALGRLLEDADDKPGGAAEGYPVVLAYDYWRTHFAADPRVIGRAMSFGASFRAEPSKGVIVGVMEPGFDSVQVGRRPDFYVPLSMTDPANQRNLSSFNATLLARLKDGVSPQAAQAQVDAVFQAKLKTEKTLKFFTFVNGKFAQADQAHVLAVPGRTGYSYLRQYYEKPLYLIEGMVGLSLLVACAYLAMLASARALTRRRELAVRIALGASRRRVALQLTWESVLLTVAGSGLGVLFAWGAERGLLTVMKAVAVTDEVELHAGPGGAVLLFTLGIAGLTVILSGVLPAWRASKVDPASNIKEGEAAIAGRRRSATGNWLVPVQIAFSLVIVTMAALMGGTVARLLAVDPGFRTSGITFLHADFSPRMPEPKYGTRFGASAAVNVELLNRIRHTPGVEGVSISQAYPLEGATYMESASAQTASGGTRTDGNLTELAVTPGYFDVFGVPLLQGRDFTLDDRGDDWTVCILNRSAAEYFFPGGDAIGGVLSMDKDTKMRVVGVVADTLYNDLRQKAPRMIYQPYLEGGLWLPYAEFEVRARDAGTAVSAVRNAFRELAPDVSVDKPVTMRELVTSSMGRERMVAMLAGFFALLTLALTGIGLYGVLNYGVVRRRTEIGVRMALGATPGGVVKMILREAMRLVL